MNAFDIPHPGSFTISDDQLAWVEKELAAATSEGQTKVLLLHCYPSDLKIGREPLTKLVDKYNVLLIDMGHTHYNEIANDGRTLYTATRSTGQIEEGPVGFSITNIDGNVASWRFVELNDLPVVMITSPGDERLSVANSPTSPTSLNVRAKIWSQGNIAEVNATLGSTSAQLHRIGDSQVWEGVLDTAHLANDLASLQVTARDSDSNTASDEIRLAFGARHSQTRADRDQENSLEAWPEHGLLGTQLGPNKNGKKW
jgi:hypothetical protein